MTLPFKSLLPLLLVHLCAKSAYSSTWKFWKWGANTGLESLAKGLRNGMPYETSSLMDKKLALSLLSFSNASYYYPNPSPTLKGRYFCEAFELIKTHKKNSVSFSAYISPDEATVVIAFRGSMTWKNIGTDLNAALRPCNLFSRSLSCGSLHAGFLEAYHSINLELIRLLKAVRPRRIYITGHSLGGALSILAGFELTSLGESFFGQSVLISVVTFGAPRVGTELFEKAYHSLRIHTVRIQTANKWNRDWVTLLPSKEYGYANPVKPGLYAACLFADCLTTAIHYTHAYEISMSDATPVDEPCLNF